MPQTPLWCFQMGTPEDPGRLCYLKADRAKRTLHVLNLLPQLADPEDILLVNLGIHYNEMDDLAVRNLHHSSMRSTGVDRSSIPPLVKSLILFSFPCLCHLQMYLDHSYSLFLRGCKILLMKDDMTMVGFALGKYELPRHRIWVETPPQHYETPTGEGHPLLLSFPAKP